jgi:hypothetical protein
MSNGLRSRSGCAWFALLLATAAVTACTTGNTGPLASAIPVEREFALAVLTWDLDKDGEVTCDEWKQCSYARDDGKSQGAASPSGRRK